MKTYSFEKLTVWNKSVDLSKKVYCVTSSFPEEEKYGLVSQMRRCSISISSNISEGSARKSPKDKARFTEVSYSSAMELLNQTIISNRLNFLTEEDYTSIRIEISEITAMLNALHKSQISS
ncbi:four helix bundle protein [Flagellimonas algicola]|uniref:Four helix bundle protein n=1 Tax=Flagellimonas algicola TaxID=2583815 RepID=A0ABY2WKB3_9FLAO|nr:four helix bundle protein [Allomuricauda algicola]TMU54859.1 four helix bundle protein [Allomuricauda algicola]